MALVWEVFTRERAADCTDAGVEDFWASTDFEYMIHRMGDGALQFWGALDGDRLVGVCALRELCRVELLFVAEDFQGQGAGAALLKQALLDAKALHPLLSRVTVEALGDSAGFFRAVGFRPAGAAYVEEGLLKTPMILGD
jgi:GNAT superfamily N-acetyltransferase